MDGHIVVSFSRADAGPVADELARLLRAELPECSVVRGGRPNGPEHGAAARDLDDAIRACRAFVLVVTPEAVRVGSPSMEELWLAEMFGRPVIALLADPAAAPPGGIGSRRTVDVTGGVAAALPELRDRLAVLIHPGVVDPAAPPMSAPAELYGRRAEVADLVDGVLSPDVRLVTVVGPSGIGKTALVCHLLQQWPASEPLGVAHLGPPSELPLGWPRLFSALCRLLPEDAAVRLAGRHRNPRETPTAMVHAVLDALGDRPAVVLVDEAETLVGDSGGTFDAALTEAVRALMAAPGHAVTVVATSRVPPGALLARDPRALHRIDLAELPAPAARALLLARDPDGALGLRDADPAALARAGGNPRALEMLAAVLATGKESLAELLDEVQDGEAAAELPDRTFDRLGLPDESERDPVDLLSDRAFDRLELLDRHAVAALASFPAPVPPVAVDHVLGQFHWGVDSRPVLRRLHERGLLLRVGERFAVRSSDRERALDGVPTGDPGDLGRDPLPISRNVMWYLATELLAAVASPSERWASVDDLAPQLAEFELHWANGDVDEAALLLMRGAADALRSWGHHRLVASLLDPLRERINQPWVNAWCVSELGAAFAGLGQPNRATDLHERAATIYNRIGDRAGEAEELGHLGHCHTDLGDLPHALRLHEHALTLHAGSGDRLAEAACRVDVAWCRTELGRPDDAVPLLRSALAVQDDLGATWSQIDALAVLGRALSRAGDLRGAVAALERGVALSREEGDRWGEARHSRLLGECRLDAGRIAEAVELHRRALDLGRAVGDREDEAVALADLARGQLLLGRPADALALAEQAFAVAAETGDLRLRATCLDALGDCHLAAGAPAAAAPHYEQAIEVADATGHGRVQVRSRVRLARLHLAAGAPEIAGSLVGTAARHPFPPAQPEIALLGGAVGLHYADADSARRYFRGAVMEADERLRRSPDVPEVAALDVRALARAGLAATGERDQAGPAAADFRAARALTSADGVVTEVLGWLDLLAPATRAGALDRLRPVAAGRADSAF